MPAPIKKTLQLLLILVISILIVTAAVRLLATDQWLVYEYNRLGFPSDPFGFSNQQRFIFASTNVHYVRGHLPDNELSKQTLNGVPLYNPREVSHMADVQAVFEWVLGVGKVAFILLMLVGWILWQHGEQRVIARAIQSGGIITSGSILFLALTAVFAWQSWFETFHLFFFKPGSWLFSYTDTLIRLFPETFWFDATLTLSIVSLLAGLALAFIGWNWRITIEKAAQTISQ